jgi:uridine kinase
MIDSLSKPTPLVIGVAGGSGSGKTTVSTRIRDIVGRSHITYIQHDHYYRDRPDLSLEERSKVNYDHPESLETPLMVEHLRQLRAGQPVDAPLYNFATHRRMEETQRMEPARVILVEGILIFAEPALREQMDMRIFVDTDADLRFIRRLKRDINERGRSLDSVIQQYLETVRPMHLEFVEPSKRYADIIVPAGGHNRVAMEMIVSRIHAVLQG